MRRSWKPLAVTAALAFVLAACGSSGPTVPVQTIPPPTAAPTQPSSSQPASSQPATTPTASPSASEPCGTTAASGPVHHVVWIIMENRSYSQVVGSSSAPYLASVARACGLATRYSGVAHPSLPNYIALTSGSIHGISDDNGPGSHPLAGPSLFSLLGNRWTSLEESMPTPCDRNSGGEYAVKHNPAAYYTGLGAACAAHDVPLGPSPDVTAAFTLVTPNLCHDMHDCSTRAGDTWLSQELPLILDSATYRAGHTAVFITWDENDSGNGPIPTYVIAPSVRPGTTSAIAFNHYSLLRTTEELLGLRPLLGGAATATSMAAAFNL